MLTMSPGNDFYVAQRILQLHVHYSLRLGQNKKQAVTAQIKFDALCNAGNSLHSPLPPSPCLACRLPMLGLWQWAASQFNRLWASLCVPKLKSPN